MSRHQRVMLHSGKGVARIAERVAEEAVAGLASRSAVGQFLRYVLVGLINTTVDFGILNLEILLTGIHQGAWLVLFNTVSFTCALVNSYFLNRSWTFRSERGGSILFAQFVLVSVGGLLINDGGIYLLTTISHPWIGTSPVLHVDEAKIATVVVSWAWNFFLYRLWVFRAHESSPMQA